MGIVNELSGDEQLEYSVIAWVARTASGPAYYARIEAKRSDDTAAALQYLTGKGDTPLLAIADLFIQADRLVGSD